MHGVVCTVHTYCIMCLRSAQYTVHGVFCTVHAYFMVCFHSTQYTVHNVFCMVRGYHMVRSHGSGVLSTVEGNYAVRCVRTTELFLQFKEIGG